MNYHEQALDLLEQFHAWDDLLRLDELIRQVERLQHEARSEMSRAHQRYVDLQVQALQIADLLDYLRREREWLARREERDLMWQHKASLLRL